MGRRVSDEVGTGTPPSFAPKPFIAIRQEELQTVPDELNGQKLVRAMRDIIQTGLT